MPSLETERVVIVLRERPSAAVAMALHRLLGLGVSEAVRRAGAGEPLLDRGLQLDDRVPFERLVEEVLRTIAPCAHDLHVVPPDEPPGDANRVDAETLRRTLRPQPPERPTLPPRPDAHLAELIARGTRAALAELPEAVARDLCLVALVTTGEALRPYLGVTIHGPGRWDLADGEQAIVGDEHLAAVGHTWDARGDLRDLDDAEAEAELAVRLATLEEALRLLDIDGVFGVGDARRRMLLLVTTMPPDGAAAGHARRLNPEGPLLREWLEEASEAPLLDPEGIALPDGTTIYAPEEVDERNETYEVAGYAPGWVLIGDDSGGGGYLVRRPGPTFDPATARAGAEVYRMDLGALTEDVAGQGEFVTDDLVGWLAERQG
ncbi:hypothetical protein SGUI_2236 [Serinicoccus hydrothermalis]|uniref:Knr4/Smi1-like domain-containing protein n=1 Tax=Serinicoccus hydrothermalis TaxID=1758689 RepID=A0A1B1NDX0_9MICO|nr:DUF4303 domain-containing protein [Serinicoccus hydrothermalis]ANS79632.1 hypothetical protein SGUI_2236 [Serinicoccus hydrothermalis]